MAPYAQGTTGLRLHRPATQPVVFHCARSALPQLPVDYVQRSLFRPSSRHPHNCRKSTSETARPREAIGYLCLKKPSDSRSLSAGQTSSRWLAGHREQCVFHGFRGDGTSGRHSNIVHIVTLSCIYGTQPVIRCKLEHLTKRRVFFMS